MEKKNNKKYKQGMITWFCKRYETCFNSRECPHAITKRVIDNSQGYDLEMRDCQNCYVEDYFKTDKGN